MPNRHRLHVPGGTYYVSRATDSRHPIFSKSDEYARFDELLPISLASSGAKLLAYCWLPESVHLVIEISDRPVADFMRDLMWRYSRSAWQRDGEARPWFRERYHATLIQAETYLQALVHYVHYLPVLASLAAAPDGYTYSSYPAYVGRRRGPPVHTRKLLALMGCEGRDRMSYIRAMIEAPPDALGRMFKHGMPDNPGVVGDPHFISQRSPRPVVRAPSSTARLIEKLIAQIAERQALTVAEICSKSRRRGSWSPERRSYGSHCAGISLR